MKESVLCVDVKARLWGRVIVSVRIVKKRN